MLKYFKQEGGVIPIVVLLVAVGLVAFLAVSNTFNFKDSIFGSLFPKPPSDAATVSQDELIPDQYIVVLNDQDSNGNKIDSEVEADSAVKEHGVTKLHTYTHALNGYAFKGSVQAAEALKNNPHVKYVSQDRKVHIDQTATPSPSETPINLPADTPQTLPTGITRIASDKNPTANVNGVDERVNVNVAILDTGVDDTHPDLHIVGGVNCSSQITGWTPSYRDGNGHGTKVSGIVGALDNAVGVVGVAPGVNLYAVRIFSNGGNGSGSDLLCGVDWVTATRTDADTTNDIAVANISGSGYCGETGAEYTCTSNDPIHDAFINSTNQGVVWVVAAGNQNNPVSGYYPALYPEVITVSAIADSDGKPGHLGRTIGLEACGHFNPAGCPDDTLSDFTNYGQGVDVAAPGVEILSTCLIWASPATLSPYCMDPYGSSGTSFSTPHVTGAVALYIGSNGIANNGSEVAAVRSNFLNSANGYVVAQNNANGFTLDKDSYPEPMLYLPNGGKIGTLPSPSPSADVTAPTVNVTSPANGATVAKGATVTISASATDNVKVATVKFYINNAKNPQCSLTNPTVSPSTYNCNWTVPKGGKANTSYTIKVTAADPSNNSATTTINITAK